MKRKIKTDFGYVEVDEAEIKRLGTKKAVEDVKERQLAEWRA